MQIDTKFLFAADRLDVRSIKRALLLYVVGQEEGLTLREYHQRLNGEMSYKELYDTVHKMAWRDTRRPHAPPGTITLSGTYDAIRAYLTPRGKHIYSTAMENVK